MSVRAKNKKEALCWNKKQYNGNFEKNYNLTHQMNFDKYIFRYVILGDLSSMKNKKIINMLNIGCGVGELSFFL